MKAIGYRKTGPISAPDSLIELEAEKPDLGPRDLLVEVRGISVNPVDVKVRTRPQMGPAEGESKVIGYDAAGIVRETGSEVSLFHVGDEVFYAGDITRQGTNAEFHAVDERIVGNKPRSLGFAEAAGMPLTAITAWELLFDSLGLSEGGGTDEALLIIGAAGGVGSILTQLAQKLTDLKVVATASRPETVEWVKKMGADHVINHHESLTEQMQKLGTVPRYVASLNGSEDHFDAIVELIQPRGHIALIDDPKTLNIHAIKPKSLSFSWEYMFARPMHQTPDMEKQHELLNRVSSLLDEGRLVSTVTKNLGQLNVENLKTAHTEQESGRVIGKNVLDGFFS
ncbi:zinc-binding alcohol dehydrogenase family protein [Coraliomargarita sinensis]|uniref:Zinc-type alcohol dehydrogenase-like protein n=1 Tax=Coraliomargarita sinensis TaxID=2174842 RepID=A0A317ZMM2_9BACT|nr:zinc-binding alcohol dehydrogenase family protein [Coraliomargarita sinensis]PXA05069.1 zinc-binding alcohol dehydrogenase family protein [Coraliomargarita sinensis]